uniref:Predicted gene 11733 n=1 Tax=Mus spicilegus TaxID=10103 RepID=A0A8C6G5L4_MUSSI
MTGKDVCPCWKPPGTPELAAHSVIKYLVTPSDKRKPNTDFTLVSSWWEHLGEHLGKSAESLPLLHHLCEDKTRHGTFKGFSWSPEWTCLIAEDDLELLMPSKCGYYGTAYVVLRMKARASCMLGKYPTN